MPYLGRISYGMYLWYWPTLLFTSGQRLDWNTYELFALRVALTPGLAALSFELWRNRFVLARPALADGHGAPIGAAAALGAVLVSLLVPVGSSALEQKQLHAPVAGSAARAPGAAGSNHLLVTTPPPRRLPRVDRRPESLRRPTQLRPSSRLPRRSRSRSSLWGTSSRAHSAWAWPSRRGNTASRSSTRARLPVLCPCRATCRCSGTRPPNSPCDIGGNPDSLFTSWRQWVDAYNPDVVVYLARGETFNQQVGGAWQNLGEPAFDSYVASRFNSATQVLGSKGAAVVFLTLPYFDSGHSGAGTPWPEDNPLRVDIDDTIMRQVAASSSGNVYVFDLNALVSPGGHYSPTVGPVNVRCGDGVHFFAIWWDLCRHAVCANTGRVGQGARAHVFRRQLAGTATALDSAMVLGTSLPIVLGASRPMPGSAGH